MVNPDTIFIAADGGILLRTYDGGKTWLTIVFDGITSADLLSVSINSQGKGLVSGRNQTLISTTSFFDKWVILRKNYFGAYYSVRQFDDQHGYAFGENSISESLIMNVAHFDSLAEAYNFIPFNGEVYSSVSTIFDAYVFSSSSLLTVGYQDGKGGSPMANIIKDQPWADKFINILFSIDSAYFLGVDFTENQGVAIGGRIPDPTSPIPNYTVLAESSDAGNTWNEVISPVPFHIFYDVKMIGKYAYIVGEAGVMLKKEFSGVSVNTNPALQLTIKLSPNPAANYTCIELSGYKNSKALVAVHSVDGSIVLQKTVNLTEPCGQKILIDVSAFKRGLYLVVVNNNGFQNSAKLLINQ